MFHKGWSSTHALRWHLSNSVFSSTIHISLPSLPFQTVTSYSLGNYVSVDPVRARRCAGSLGTWWAVEPEAIYRKLYHEVNQTSNGSFATTQVSLKPSPFNSRDILHPCATIVCTAPGSSFGLSLANKQAHCVICVLSPFHSAHGVLCGKTENSASPARELIAPDSYLHWKMWGITTH